MASTTGYTGILNDLRAGKAIEHVVMTPLDDKEAVGRHFSAVHSCTGIGGSLSVVARG